MEQILEILQNYPTDKGTYKKQNVEFFWKFLQISFLLVQYFRDNKKMNVELFFLLCPHICNIIGGGVILLCLEHFL